MKDEKVRMKLQHGRTVEDQSIYDSVKDKVMKEEKRTEMKGVGYLLLFSGKEKVKVFLDVECGCKVKCSKRPEQIQL